jgi:ABC-type multidrug transport system fused ATPase/permease subunit
LGSLRASRRLYDKLLKRILGAKMRFFDSTPSGRIINRLSKDMSSIDTEAGESTSTLPFLLETNLDIVLMVVLLYFLQTILAVAASLGVVVFSTPAFILPLIAIALVYWFIGLLYVTTSRELKRMDVSHYFSRSYHTSPTVPHPLD